jgi:hypothetical protein
MITVATFCVLVTVILTHILSVFGDIAVVFAQIAPVGPDICSVVGKITPVAVQIAPVVPQVATIAVDVGLIGGWGGGCSGRAGLRSRCVAEYEQAGQQARGRRF